MGAGFVVNPHTVRHGGGRVETGGVNAELCHRPSFGNLDADIRKVAHFVTLVTGAPAEGAKCHSSEHRRYRNPPRHDGILAGRGPVVPARVGRPPAGASARHLLRGGHLGVLTGRNRSELPLGSSTSCNWRSLLARFCYWPNPVSSCRHDPRALARIRRSWCAGGNGRSRAGERIGSRRQP